MKKESVQLAGETAWGLTGRRERRPMSGQRCSGQWRGEGWSVRNPLWVGVQGTWKMEESNKVFCLRNYFLLEQQSRPLVYSQSLSNSLLNATTLHYQWFAWKNSGRVTAPWQMVKESRLRSQWNKRQSNPGRWAIRRTQAFISHPGDQTHILGRMSNFQP